MSDRRTLAATSIAGATALTAPRHGIKDQALDASPTYRASRSPTRRIDERWRDVLGPSREEDQMTYWTVCDWCGRRIDREDDYAEMPVTIHHRAGKSTLDARWAEETKPTRFFCASPKEDTDRGGRDRAGLVPEETFDSCYDRALAAITGVELSEPGMGLEWRLMAVEEPAKTTAVRESRATEGSGDDDLSIVELDISVRAYNALHRAGIDTIGKLRAELNENRALEHLYGIGAKCCNEIDAALMKFDRGAA